MTTTILALVVGAAMLAGAAGAYSFTRWIAREGDRKVALMAGVTAWVILFGIAPFLLFAVLAGGARQGASPPAWAALVLNLIPFALLASPVAGFVQGLRVSARKGAKAP